MIEKCSSKDLHEIYIIINDAATAYKGIIPDGCYHDPYMSKNELDTQIKEGVEFWCYKQSEKFLGVMGIQFKNEVTLVRHAYVRTNVRGKGIGSKLLMHLLNMTQNPVLIGTWKDAIWAIQFYQRHGFQLVNEKVKDELLCRYWSIPQKQAENSVVLASAKFKDKITAV
jgi:Acetyltransferases